LIFSCIAQLAWKKAELHNDLTESKCFCVCVSIKNEVFVTNTCALICVFDELEYELYLIYHIFVVMDKLSLADKHSTIFADRRQRANDTRSSNGAQCSRRFLTHITTLHDFYLFFTSLKRAFRCNQVRIILSITRHDIAPCESLFDLSKFKFNSKS